MKDYASKEWIIKNKNIKSMATYYKFGNYRKILNIKSNLLLNKQLINKKAS